MLKYNNDNKTKITVALVLFALAILVILIIVHIDPIASFLSMLMSIFAPVIVGGAIAYLLNPLLKFLEFVVFKKINSKKIVRVLSLILTYVFAFLFIGLVVAVIAPQLVNNILDIGKNYNLYIQEAIGIVNGIVSKFSVNFENFDAEKATALIKEIFTETGDIFETVMNYVLNYSKTLITVLKNLLIGLFISIYILVSKERLYAQATKGARAILSDKAWRACMRYLRITNATFGRFFVGKLFDSLIITIATAIVVLSLGIQHAALISIIIGVLNIIPFFGMIIGIIISAFIVFIASPEKILAFVLIMIILQQIDTNIIAPKILGSSAGISSLGVIIAVIIMGSYFGMVGVIIGVPIFAIAIFITKEWLEKRLSKKEMPVNTAEYYTDPDYSDNEDHKSLTRIMGDNILSVISKGINKAISYKLKKEEDESEETDDLSDNEDKN